MEVAIKDVRSGGAIRYRRTFSTLAGDKARGRSVRGGRQSPVDMSPLTARTVKATTRRVLSRDDGNGGATLSQQTRAPRK